jgi:hypothetical protein
MHDIVAGTVSSDGDVQANDSVSSIPLALPPLQPHRALLQDVDFPGGVGVADIASKRPRVRNANITRPYAKGVQRHIPTLSAPVERSSSRPRSCVFLLHHWKPSAWNRCVRRLQRRQGMRRP